MTARRLTFRPAKHLLLVGTFFALLGLGLAGMCGWMATVGAAEEPIWLRGALLAAGTFPLAVAVVGVWLTFGYYRVTIDGVQREVSVRRGFLWTWAREVHSFDDIEHVGLGLEVTTGHASHNDGHRSSSDFPVRLEGREFEVELASPSRYEPARATAERVANLVGLGLRDWSSRDEIVREAGTLDESLRSRVLRTGEQADWPGAPPSNRLSFTRSGDELVIDEAPVRGGKLWRNVGGAGLLVVVWIAVSIPGLHWAKGLASGAETHLDAARLAALAMCALPFLPIIYVAAASAVFPFLHERVVVSPRMVRREWRAGPLHWVCRMSTAQIEELVMDRDDVVLRSDRRSIRLGLLLSRKERRWLAAAVRFGMCQPG